MPEVIQITTGRASKLGAVVEVREMTVEQWLARNENENASNDGISMLADMLYIDGKPVGMERLLKLGFQEIQEPMRILNKLIGEDQSGNE